MARARSRENGAHGDGPGGAASAVPPTNPLTVVEAAVAGTDLPAVARTVSEAIGNPVVIALPTFSPPVAWPASTDREAVDALAAHARAVISGAGAEAAGTAPDMAFEAVPVRLGPQLVGIVGALGSVALSTGVRNVDAPTRRAWLEAAAAAAAVAALMQESGGEEALGARRTVLHALTHGQTDTDGTLAAARRLGYDFSHGAQAVGAYLQGEPNGPLDWTRIDPLALAAESEPGRILALVPLGAETTEPREPAAAPLLQMLSEAGATAVASGPRRAPAAIADALREASVLLELLTDPQTLLTAQEETYRLLVGVLLRDPAELAELRASTIAELEQYDALHDTELVGTLEAFLAHHGSTTETAEAMQLHRHTVGYRLARVQEVSGLSPYESDGRERLSLGLKAHRIMLADARRQERGEGA